MTFAPVNDWSRGSARGPPRSPDYRIWTRLDPPHAGRSRSLLCSKPLARPHTGLPGRTQSKQHARVTRMATPCPLTQRPSSHDAEENTRTATRTAPVALTAGRYTGARDRYTRGAIRMSNLFRERISSGISCSVEAHPRFHSRESVFALSNGRVARQVIGLQRNRDGVESSGSGAK